MRTCADAAAFMSDTISDVIDDNIDYRKANTLVNATGKMLKAVEMGIRYGKPVKTGGRRELSVA